MDNKKNSWHYTIGERRELDVAKQRQKLARVNADACGTILLGTVIGVAIALGVAVLFVMCGIATATMLFS